MPSAMMIVWLSRLTRPVRRRLRTDRRELAQG